MRLERSDRGRFGAEIFSAVSGSHGGSSAWAYKRGEEIDTNYIECEMENPAVKESHRGLRAYSRAD